MLRVAEDWGRGGIDVGRMGADGEAVGRRDERCWRSSGKEGGESFILLAEV